MVTRMKTTVEIPEELIREVKQLGAETGATMRELIVEGLRREIERRRTRPPADFVFRTVDGGGLAPGIDPKDVIRLSYELPPL
jgi:hypothetical protein